MFDRKSKKSILLKARVKMFLALVYPVYYHNFSNLTKQIKNKMRENDPFLKKLQPKKEKHSLSNFLSVC